MIAEKCLMHEHVVNYLDLLITDCAIVIMLR